MHLGQECPEIYKDPNPRKYIWPLRDYEIFRYANGETLQLTNYPGYNAETTILRVVWTFVIITSTGFATYFFLSNLNAYL